MKKVALLLTTILCLSFSANAQNAIEVVVEDDICVSSFTAVLSNNSEVDYDLGCGGSYNFDLDESSVAYIIVYGVVCFPDTTTEINLDNNKKVTVGYKNSKVTFGGGTTSTDRIK